MKLRLTLSILVLATSVLAVEVDSIKVAGDDRAEVSFSVKGEGPTPSLRTQENMVEVTFSNATLSDALKKNAEQSSPHALVHRLQSYEPDKGTVRTRIVLNGTAERLKDRVAIERASGGYLVKIDFPKGGAKAIELFKEEQAPLSQTVTSGGAKKPSESRLPMFILCIVLLGSSAAALFGVKYLKGRTKIGGSRKYLIEQLGYCALAPKSGVSLVKVGNEFVLLGVTPGQVTFLSNLPKLQEKYEAESDLERKDFRVAVEDEYRRMKPAPRGAA